MNKKMVLCVSTQREAEALAHTSSFGPKRIVVLGQPYVPPRSTKEKPVPDFKDFVIDQQAKTQFRNAYELSNELVFLAPHNHDGLRWLAQYHNYCESCDFDTDSMVFCTYVALDYANTDYTNIPRRYLQALYRVYVFNTVIASVYYTKVASVIGRVFVGDKRQALSLGMFRVLTGFATIYNPLRVLQSIKNADDSIHRLDPYLAPRLQGAGDKFVSVLQALTDNFIDFLLPKHDSDHDTDAIDPYITCLTGDINLTKYTALVQAGILSVAVPQSLPAHSAYCLSNNLCTRFKDLIDSGVIEEKALETFRTGTQGKNSKSLPYGTFTLKGADSVPDNDFDYSILYDRYNTRWMLRYLAFPSNTARVVFAYSSIPALIHNPDNAYLGWLGLLDPGCIRMVSRESTAKVSASGVMASDVVSDELIDGPSALRDIFTVLNSYYGYSYSYTYTLIKQLSARGFIKLTCHGARITEYGYTVAHYIGNYMGPAQMELNKLYAKVNDTVLYWNDDPISGEHSELLDQQYIGFAITQAVETIEAMAACLKTNLAVLVTKTRKTKSGKKLKYTLIADHNSKTAYWKHHTKKLPVVAVPKNSGTLKQFNVTLISSEPGILGKAQLGRISLRGYGCPSCSCVDYYTGYDKTTGQRTLMCCDCQRIQDYAPFTIDEPQKKEI